MGTIDKKEALSHLVISRDQNGSTDFEKKFEECMKEKWDILKIRCQLDNKRFTQCFEDSETKYFKEEIPTDRLYNKYFLAGGWGNEQGYLKDVCKTQHLKDRVKIITSDYKNPRITTINVEGEKNFNVLDGMHRTTAYIKNGKIIIPAIIILVKEDFKE